MRAAKTTAKQGRNVAERAALVSVGATLEARDRAVALVNDLRDVATSRNAAEKRIGKLERRGTTARNQLERDVRKARTRLERELRGRRRDAERLVRRNRAQVESAVESPPRSASRRSRKRANTSPFRRLESGGSRESSPASYPAGECSTLSSLNRRRAFGHGGGA